MADEYEYYDEEEAEEEEEEEYEYYDEEEEYADGGDEYWYEDATGTPKSPPANILEMMASNYSQVLLVNQDNDPPRSEQQPHTMSLAKLAVGGGVPPPPARNGQRRDFGRGRQQTVGADHNMRAVNVIKGLFEHQRVDQLPTPLSPEDLEQLAPVVESIICGSPNIPPFVLNLFRTSLSNMFGTVNIDFELLNNDYLYIKSVFVDGTESNNSSLRFERIMSLMQNAKISTMQMSHVHVSAASMENLILYLANDDNYDQNGHLKNSVNQMVVHRQSGLTYAQIEAQYAEQFTVCGWSMSYEAQQQHIVISLHTADQWDYYDEDFDDDEKEDNRNSHNQSQPQPQPPQQPSQAQYVQQQIQALSVQQQQQNGSSNSLPFPAQSHPKLTSKKTMSPPRSNRPSYLMQNGDIPPPPSKQPRGSSGHVQHNMRQTPKQVSAEAHAPPPPTVTTQYEEEEEEYDYYYENDDGTFCPASPRMAQTQTSAIPPPPAIATTSISPPPSQTTAAVGAQPVAATALQHQPAQSVTTLLMNMQYEMQNLDATMAHSQAHAQGQAPQLMGLMGLPPPDSDDDDGDVDSEQNKLKFLSEVLSRPHYEGRTLFAGFLAETVDAMQRLNVGKGQCILKETEHGQNFDLKFFVIEYGVFNVYQRGQRLPMELCSKSTFGEAQLMFGTPQFVTIRAATNKCCAWYLSRSQYYQLSWHFFNKPFKNRLKTKLPELVNVCTLGIGSFGRVYLVRDPHSKKTFSLKKLSKNTVIENKQQQHIMNERSVLALISKTNPAMATDAAAADGGRRRAQSKSSHRRDQNTFCCKLYGLYQDQFYLYFLMEPLLGGELFTLLRHNKKFSEKVARFYLSCMVVAFDHLHSRNIIYRDIKPENIMLASNGYAKLVDFGLAKPRNNTRTCCGTPEYLAPEIIQNYWHGFEIDFWGLGILLYEMTTGQPPFESYEQILGDAVPRPSQQTPSQKPMSPELWHLMNALLIKLPYQRLGTTSNRRKGIQEIYQHPWFQGKMEWNALKAQKFRPPYVPDIENDEDVSNFEEVEAENSLQHETLFNDQSLYKWCEYF